MWRNSNGSLIFLLVSLFLTMIGSCTPVVEHRWEDDKPKDDGLSWRKVRAVLSGDTIQLEDGKIVKYLGIVSPQKGEAFFEECRRANAFLLKPGKVVLLWDDDKVDLQDSQGRYLAYVFSPSLGIFCFVNQELLLFGYARIAKSEQHKYQQDFLKTEQQAKNKKMGIWQWDSQTPP